MDRAAILILGMHRSGTSAFAWMAGRLGATLPADGIGATDDNAKGYYESEQLVRADDQLLRVCRSSWFDPRPLDWSRLPASGLRSRKARIREAIAAQWGDAPLLAIKDPRQCRFVPILADVLAEMGIAPRALLVLRPAAEVVASLAARDGTSRDYAHLLWLRHMIDAERATRDMPRAVVSYPMLLTNWRAAMARIAPLAGRQDYSPDGETTRAVEQFVDPALRHYRHVAGEALEQPLAGIVASVEARLDDLIAGDDDPARARLDQAYALLDAAPWLEGEIVHDELRYRRMPRAVTAAVATPPTPPVPEPPRTAAPRPSPTQADDIALIRGIGLFDTAWYLERYPDAAESGLDPVEHYVTVGAPKGYDPNPLFQTNYYARQMAVRLAADETR